MRVFFLALTFALSLFVTTAQAHTRSQSYSNWNTDGKDINFIFAVDAYRVTQLVLLQAPASDLQALLQSHVQDTVSAWQDEEPCDLTDLRPIGQLGSTIRISGRFSCPKNAPGSRKVIKITSFFEVSPTHIHMARFESVNDVADFVLDGERTTFILAHDENLTGFAEFLGVGFFHVLSGLDHLVFLIALALVARQLSTAIFCITGFTLGHTLALFLASYGLILPNISLVEALIGFTIAFTALEAGTHFGLERKLALSCFALLSLLVFQFPVLGAGKYFFTGLALTFFSLASAQIGKAEAEKLLPVLTTVFGLVHGVGFSGTLLEFSTTSADILWPLFGFNIGVELAQTLALGVIYGVLLLKLKPVSRATLQIFSALAVFSLGCYWFAVRIWT